MAHNRKNQTYELSTLSTCGFNHYRDLVSNNWVEPCPTEAVLNGTERWGGSSLRLGPAQT